MINPKTITGQTDGFSVSLDKTLGEHLQYNEHQISITVRDDAGAVAVPTAGTLALKALSPGAEDAEDVANWDNDLTDRASWTQIISGRVERFDFTEASLDADHTVDIAIASGRA